MRQRPSGAGEAIDFAAAAIFAGAIAFAAAALASAVAAGLLAPLAFGAAFAGLRRVDAGPRHALAQFPLRPLDCPSAHERTSAGNVVRLFEPGEQAVARPSPPSPVNAPPDAGQALGDALARLKRSLAD